MCGSGEPAPKSARSTVKPCGPSTAATSSYARCPPTTNANTQGKLTQIATVVSVPGRAFAGTSRLRGKTMPIYRFLCEQCALTFEEHMSPVEHDDNRPQCPRCHTDACVHGARSTSNAPFGPPD